MKGLPHECEDTRDDYTRMELSDIRFNKAGLPHHLCVKFEENGE